MNYFWSGSVHTHWGPGPVNTNWGPGSVNTNWGPGSVNTNLGPGPVNTILGPGPGPGAGKYKYPICDSIEKIMKKSADHPRFRN